ncbi:interferon regulatory factor 5-like [Mustela erminea]|uniref:interferon regulatory factor 5-like n=1 Tax=Mustela erminea TaxID=36723 RepID=UPI001386F9F0|nr:interferon regulatory factor 5-like [Mustela erminea]
MGQSSSKNDPPVEPKRFYPSLDPFDAAPWPPDLQPGSLAEGPPARPPSTNPFIQPLAPTPPPPYCPPPSEHHNLRRQFWRMGLMPPGPKPSSADLHILPVRRQTGARWPGPYFRAPYI